MGNVSGTLQKNYGLNLTDKVKLICEKIVKDFLMMPHKNRTSLKPQAFVWGRVMVKVWQRLVYFTRVVLSGTGISPVWTSLLNRIYLTAFNDVEYAWWWFLLELSQPSVLIRFSSILIFRNNTYEGKENIGSEVKYQWDQTRWCLIF